MVNSLAPGAIMSSAGHDALRTCSDGRRYGIRHQDGDTTSSPDDASFNRIKLSAGGHNSGGLRNDETSAADHQAPAPPPFSAIAVDPSAHEAEANKILIRGPSGHAPIYGAANIYPAGISCGDWGHHVFGGRASC